MNLNERPSGFRSHLDAHAARVDAALAKAGYEHLLVASGVEKMRFLDDMPYPFKANPQFKAWLPLTRNPGSWLLYSPGARPKLIYLQPRDYWHVVPQAPAGDWTEHFDIVVIRTPEEALPHLPADAEHCAILGEAQSALERRELEVTQGAAPRPVRLPSADAPADSENAAPSAPGQEATP